MYWDDYKQFFEGRHYRVVFVVDSYNQCGDKRYFSTKELAEKFVQFQSKFGIHCTIYEYKVFD